MVDDGEQKIGITREQARGSGENEVGVLAEVQTAGDENEWPVEQTLLAQEAQTGVRDRREEVRRDGVGNDANPRAERGKVMGEAVGRELRDGVDHVGAGGEPTEQE